VGTEPNDLTPSAGFTAGAGDGDEDIGAEVSSIEPNVTADPSYKIQKMKRAVHSRDTNLIWRVQYFVVQRRPLLWGRPDPKYLAGENVTHLRHCSGGWTKWG
jgi:hypothetical protein